MDIKYSDSSFRDPSGYVFYFENELYRTVSNNYKENYNYLIESGLFDALFKKQQLVFHKEISKDIIPHVDNIYKIIKPDRIPFVSYPFEWSFTQLKDAALLTLEICETAISHNMILKDASSFNILFNGYKPVFIDTLSFCKYEEGKTWIAYRQFCRHFLAPLVLATVDPRFLSLSSKYIDGIPLDLAVKILPLKKKINLGVLLHLYFHSKAEIMAGNSDHSKIRKKFSKASLLGLITSLKNVIKKIKIDNPQSEWSGYYSTKEHSTDYFESKKKAVHRLTDMVAPLTILDIGANTGEMSRIIHDDSRITVLCDSDPLCADVSYLRAKQNKDEKLFSLVIDFTNPSAGIGWANYERESFFKRAGRFDLVLALGILHHIAIADNIPLSKIAGVLSTLSENLIVEYIPKEDYMVKKMLSSREDIFQDYNIPTFEKEFSKFFTIHERIALQDSDRILYLFQGINK